jgi:deazaflavin-dependent oxidoreductase (nitroreductase family)
MRAEWPVGFERKGTLRISTIGRRTGRRHDVTTWFAVDDDGRFFVATQDTRRDWVKNATKNPSVEVTIGGATRKMEIFPLKTEWDRQHVNDLYAKGFAHYGAFELLPQ